MSKFIRILGVLVVICGVGYYFALMTSSVPDSSDFELDMTTIRSLANEGGSLPVRINSELISRGEMPAIAIMAGESWDPVDIDIFSFQVIYPTASIIIDTAMDEEMTKNMIEADFRAEPYARMMKAMEEAHSIVMTHEHFDHIGGLVVHPALKDLLIKASITKEQIKPSSM